MDCEKNRHWSANKRELCIYLNFKVKSFVLESAAVEALHLKWFHNRKYNSKFEIHFLLELWAAEFKIDFHCISHIFPCKYIRKALFWS